ncbi:MAG: UPF0149 family protein [Mariprofundaceae bacterium]|nr:UPF0149 family protein [Mariprofundaceae bacterium]
MSKIVRLTSHALQKLDEFLNSENVPSTTMDIATLEGFLTAIVIGPQIVVPSEWLPWVWDFEDGEAEVEFASVEQAEWVINSIMGMMNSIADTFAEDPESFEPLFWRSPEWGASEWCEGFLLATKQLNSDAWSSLWALDAFKDVDIKVPRLITPFIRLGDDTGIEITSKEGDGRKWMEAVQPALVEIHTFWQERRKPALEQMADFGAQLAGRTIRRDAPKIGRNDPCPCGSGRKYKKCCGASPTIH